MTGRSKILVVDDQIAMAMMMVFLLSRAAFQAEAALTAKQALRRAQAERFDLITVDIGLPDLNGFSLFQRLREIPQLRKTPIIFVTGQATAEERERALEMGAADFIGKPFEPHDFISRVRSHLEATAAA